MKSCSASAIFVLLRLSLFIFALSVASPCTIDGSYVFESDHRLELKCTGEIKYGQEKRWELEDLPIRVHNKKTTSEGLSSILTMDNLTLTDSGSYKCICYDSAGDTASHVHQILVFDAYLRASRIDGSCEVAILLMVTVRDKDHTHSSVTSFHCPTLSQGDPRIWPFTSIANRRGEHMMHMVAVGNSGESTNTCNFTINYQPNGSNYSEHFSKTVTVDGKSSSCNNPNTYESHVAHTTEEAGASRATQPQKYLATASMLLAPLYQFAEWLL